MSRLASARMRAIVSALRKPIALWTTGLRAAVACGIIFGGTASVSNTNGRSGAHRQAPARTSRPAGSACAPSMLQIPLPSQIRAGTIEFLTPRSDTEGRYQHVYAVRLPLCVPRTEFRRWIRSAGGLEDGVFRISVSWDPAGELGRYRSRVRYEGSYEEEGAAPEFLPPNDMMFGEIDWRPRDRSRIHVEWHSDFGRYVMQDVAPGQAPPVDERFTPPEQPALANDDKWEFTEPVVDQDGNPLDATAPEIECPGGIYAGNLHTTPSGMVYQRNPQTGHCVIIARRRVR